MAVCSQTGRKCVPVKLANMKPSESPLTPGCCQLISCWSLRLTVCTHELVRPYRGLVQAKQKKLIWEARATDLSYNLQDPGLQVCSVLFGFCDRLNFLGCLDLCICGHMTCLSMLQDQSG